MNIRLQILLAMVISLGIPTGCIRRSLPVMDEKKNIGSSQSVAVENTEIVSSEKKGDTPGLPPGPIDKLVIRDAAKAKKILETTLESPKQVQSAWAAVYIQLLRVEADHDKVAQGLQNGTESEDELLKALCWRWLVTDSDSSLPPVERLGNDPVVRLFASLAFWMRGKNSDPSVKETLTLGKAVHFNLEKMPLNTLLKRSAPFDNGALALAIAFTNARRMELATTVEGVTVPRSAGYRQQLFTLLGVPPMESIKNEVEPFTFEGTQLHKRLEGPMEGQSLEMLRKVIVRSSDTLQMAALRELASRAIVPQAGDLAAAATAMNVDNRLIRLEAARTYLLLVSRATTE